MKGGLLSTASTAKPSHDTTSTWEGSSVSEHNTPSAEEGSTKPNEEKFQNGGGKSRTGEAKSSDKDFKSIFNIGLVTLLSGSFLVGVGITATGGALCFLCRRTRVKQKSRKIVEQTSKDLVEVKKSLADNKREIAVHLNGLRLDTLETRRDVKREIKESRRGIEDKLREATLEQEQGTEMGMMNSQKSIVKNGRASDRRMKHKVEMETESWRKTGVTKDTERGTYTKLSSFHHGKPSDYQVGGAVPDAERMGLEPDIFEERKELLEETERTSENE